MQGKRSREEPYDEKFTLNEWGVLHLSLDLSLVFLHCWFRDITSLHWRTVVPHCMFQWKRLPYALPHLTPVFLLMCCTPKSTDEHSCSKWVQVGWRKCYFKYERSWREAGQIIWRLRCSISNYTKGCCANVPLFVAHLFWCQKKKSEQRIFLAMHPCIYTRN